MDYAMEEMQVVFPSRGHTSEALQPSEEPFDLPASFVPAQPPAVLCDVTSVRAVGRDEFDAARRAEPPVARVAVVRFVAQESRGRARG